MKICRIGPTLGRGCIVMGPQQRQLPKGEELPHPTVPLYALGWGSGILPSPQE